MNWEDVLATSDGIAGGSFTQEAQHSLSRLLDGSTIRLTTSGTDALEMSAILADIEPGDTVIVPAFGFVTTALAFVRAGAQIRFVDIEENSLGMDPNDLADKMDAGVRAVVPIHYGGVACDIESLMAVVDDHERAILIEDNAHGLLGSFKDRPLGTFGALACLSFHGTKNLSCGEGGAIVINDSRLIDRAEVVLEKGTDRRRFLRGEIDKYTWRDLGSSFGLSDYLAAVLLDQIERVEDIQRRRESLSDLYMERLSPYSASLGFDLPKADRDKRPAHHLFYVILEDSTIRDDLLTSLNELGIRATFHYPPLNRTPGGRRWGDGDQSHCPVSERISGSLVRLPLHHEMSEKDAERIAERFIETLSQHRDSR